MNEIQYIQKHGAKKVRYPAYGRLTDQLQEDGFTGDLDALIRLISACEMVELLGGYEEAKKEFAEQLNADKPYPNETENNKRILLDYRRAHNIFEVGDYALPISNYSDQVHFLSEWYIENLDFRYTTKSGSWGILIKACMGTAWRHATDPEIKANRRLDQEPKCGRAVQLEKLKQTIIATTTPSGESPFYQAFCEAVSKGSAMVEITWDEGRDITAELITERERQQ